MRAVVQRVTAASVSIAGEVVGAIEGPGLCVLVGVTHDDDEERARLLAARLWNLRVLADEEGRMNRSAAELGAHRRSPLARSKWQQSMYTRAYQSLPLGPQGRETRQTWAAGPRNPPNPLRQTRPAKPAPPRPAPPALAPAARPMQRTPRVSRETLRACAT